MKNTGFGVVVIIGLIIVVLAFSVAYANSIEKEPLPHRPSLVPHELDSRAGSCNLCHQSAISGAVVSPHPERLGCTGCHIEER